MKNISFRFPTSVRDIKVLWKEYTSKRYRKNIEVMRKMTDFYISNALKGKKQSIESVEKRAKTLQKSIGKKVNQYTLDGEFVASYNSFNEARRLTGIWDASVRSCCIGRFKQAGGYIWRFATEVTFENSPQEVELKLIENEK